MLRKRHTAKEIIHKFCGVDAQVTSGASVAAVSKKPSVSKNRFHRWRAQYGRMRTIAGVVTRTREEGRTPRRVHGRPGY